MKNIFIITALLFVSLSCFASQPGELQIARTILADSGIRGATNVALDENGYGPEYFTLTFDYNNESYDCQYFIDTPTFQTQPGQYVVARTLMACRDSDHEHFQLHNDYTDGSGKSVFERLFFNNNTAFRFLNPRERQLRIMR